MMANQPTISLAQPWGDTAAEVVRTWERYGRPQPVEGAATTVWEAGAGEPVVCLHGVPASAFLYRKLLPELAARGLRGIAFDFPGLGLAERPARFDYSWSGLSAWTVRALDALSLERFHLVVHDIGGPIGFDVVRRIPGRLRSLTVLNTMVRPASFRRPWMMEPFAWPGLGALYLRALTPLGVELLLRREGVAGPVPAAELRAYAHLLKRGDDGAAFLKIMGGFELTAAFEERTIAALQRRAFPAQVLWGQGDPSLRIERHGYEARAVLGVKTVQALPGKHFVQEDSPGAIAEAVRLLAAQA